MNSDRQPAEVFPPGEYIRAELIARGLRQGDLATILGCAPEEAIQLIKGKREVTLEIAERLGAAFGTGSQLWLNLEKYYQKAKLIS